MRKDGRRTFSLICCKKMRISSLLKCIRFSRQQAICLKASAFKLATRKWPEARLEEVRCILVKQLFVLTVLLFTTPAFSKVIERIVAIVNDDIITQTDVTDYKRKLRSNQFLDDTLVRNPSELLENSKMLIDHLVNEKLMDTEVRKQNLNVTDERVQQEVQKIAQANRINTRQLIQALRDEKISFQDYKHFLKTKLERQSLIERVIVPYIQISDEDIANYYYTRLQKSKSSKKPQFEYNIQHISFSWASSGQTDIQTAKSQAEKALSLLKSGTNFDSLTQKYNRDKDPLMSGGSLGTFKSNELLASFDAAIQNLEIGQFSQVVRGHRGFHILKLTSKRLIEDPNLTKRRSDIHNALYQEAFRKRLALWLDQRRHQSFIKINS